MVNASVAQAAFGNPVVTLAATVAAGFPDMAETCTFLPHRSLFHSLTGWAIAASPAVLAILAQSHPEITNQVFAALPNAFEPFALSLFGTPLVLPLVSGFIVGCLLHILADSLSVSGVPLFLPVGRTISYPLYRTHHATEFFVASIIIFLACLVIWLRGFIPVALPQWHW